MFKHKKLFIIGVIAASLMIANFMGALPYLVGRTVSSIYATLNYPERKLKFESGEYAYGFGDYSIMYKDKDGEYVNFMMTPKGFPVFIVWDSIRKDGFDD